MKSVFIVNYGSLFYWIYKIPDTICWERIKLSHTTERFRKLLSRLPKEIKKQAREAYVLFKIDPYYPGLHFTSEYIHPGQSILFGYYNPPIGIASGNRGVALQKKG